MTRKVSLSVNDMPINLDYFVQHYFDHVIGGIISSLHDTGEIDNLELDIDNKEQVTISLNGEDVLLKEFPNEIIRSTILGMVSMLKGVGQVDRLAITLSR